MSSARVHFSLFRGGASEAVEGASAREIQEFWFTLTRLRWSSLVLVPADEGMSTAPLANALADVGGRLRDSPVTAIIADSMDYESARMLADLQFRVQADRRSSEGVQIVESHLIAPFDPSASSPSASPGDVEGSGRPPHEAKPLPTAGQIVVAIQPVLVEPLGIAIAHAADAVVICIELGKTRTESARRTIELIGANRVAGAFLVK